MADYKLFRVQGAPVSDEDLLADLQRVAALAGASTVGQKEYRRSGLFADSTLTRRFGGWNAALTAAGLQTSHQVYSDDDLFENLFQLWAHRGRQPRRRELGEPPSTISWTPYARRFGNWGGALRAFVAFANGDDGESVPVAPAREGADGQQSTPRFPNLRLRFKVLQRDRFMCVACGASPARSPGIELEVDHIVPWSRGGETALDNLQTLCRPCNSGKGGMHDDPAPTDHE